MNLIVIVTDSLRADHCGCYPQCQRYQGRPVATPHFDRLARDSSVFHHAYGESLPTMPTRTTWWTGRVCFPVRGWQPFELSDYPLAEILWDRGYTSALFSDTYHLHKPGYNLNRGFDTVGWVRGNEYDPWIVGDVPVDLAAMHRLRGDQSDALWRPRFEQYLRNRTQLRREEDHFAPQVTQLATAWLEQQVQRGRRDHLFLWADYFTPHEPWDPPPPFRDQYKDPAYTGPDLIDPAGGPVAGYLTAAEVQRVKSLYAGSVTFADKWVGALLDAVRTLGLYDDSLIMWLSDHGEPFGEHGIIRKARPWSHEELVHIPWLMKLPAAAGVPPGPVEALVQPTDFLPTVLDALGIPVAPPPGGTAAAPAAAPSPTAPAKVRLHGHSLLPLVRGEVASVRRYAYSGWHRQSWAIQDHEWRYQMFLAGGQPAELFHRPNDPYDQRNVIAAHPAVARALRLELQRYVARVAGG